MVSVFITALLSIIVLQILLLVTFLLLQKKGRLLSNRLLAAFFLLLGINLTDGLLGLTGLYQQFPSLAHLEDGLVFLLGPLLYFYTRSVVYRGFRLDARHLLHLVPFVVATFSFQVYYHSLPAEQQVFIQKAITDRTLPAGFYFSMLVIYGHVFSYFLLAFNELRFHEKKILDLFSSTEKVSLKWVRFLIVAMVGILVFSLVNVMMPFAGLGDWFLPSFGVVVGLFFLFVNAVVLKGLLQPEIFAALEPDEQPKYGSSLLSAAEKETIRSGVAALMEKEKAYLNPDLTLEELATRANTQPKKLSQVINELLGKNYYDYVNSYRINAAAHLLATSTDPKLTVLEVLYQVGFNSKSSFNTLFREKMGVTPSDYRKAALRQAKSSEHS